MKKILPGILFLLTPLFAQGSPLPPEHGGHSVQQQDIAGMQMDMQGMETHKTSTLPSPHEVSGTAWQPVSVKGYEWMWMRGGWMFMAHGEIFIDYNQQGGPRGGGKPSR